MKAARAGKLVAAAIALTLVAGVVAPRFKTDRYRSRIQRALESALGRKVTFGEVKFNLLTGPGFTLHDVAIAEDPALGFEPVAYVDLVTATPRLLTLLTGHLAFSSLRLEDAHLNLARADLPNGEYRWNIEPLLRPAIIAAFPNITIHGARINFKAANVKSVVYLLDCDLSIEPPSGTSETWGFLFEGKPARADRTAHGSGLIRARGTWKPGSLDADLQLERSELGDVIAVLRGEDAGLHGLISGSARFKGPLNRVAVNGRLRVEELHGWNQNIPRGEAWPLDLQGFWNSTGQQLELDARVAGKGTSPLAVHYLVEQYLTQPRWGASVTLARFPAAPLVPLAQHMGLPLTPGLEIGGIVDGVVGYSVASGYRGQARIENATLKLPGSPQLQVKQAEMTVTDGVAKLSPVRIFDSAEQEGVAEGEYNLFTGATRFRLAARNLDAGTLGKVPVLSDARSGKWSGALQWALGSWSGDMQLNHVEFASPALSGTVFLDSAQCHLESGGIVISKMRGHTGPIPFAGDYRYEPDGAHPHRFRLTTGPVDAANLEAALLPTLHRRTGVLGVDLPFARQSLPEWLSGWHAEGQVQMASLGSAEWQLTNLRAKVQWDAGRIALTDVTAGNIAGHVNIDLQGREPLYEITGRLKNQEWKGGHITIDTAATVSGIGAKLLRTMEATGAFQANAIDDNLDHVTGRYELTWRTKVPRLSVSAVRLQSAAETYTGKGNLQQDGTLSIQLISPTRQARLSGPLTPEAPFRWTSRAQ